MERSHVLIRALTVIACVGACGSERATPAPMFTAAVAPPFGLDRIRGGMSAAEAMAAVPDLLIEANTPTTSVLAMKGMPTGTRAKVYREDDRIAQVVILLDTCGELDRTLETAWGPSHPGKTQDGRLSIWSSRQTGWVAAVRGRRDQSDCSLTFTSVAYFGTPATPPGVLVRIRAGMSATEVERTVPSSRLNWLKSDWLLSESDWALTDTSLVIRPPDGRVLDTILSVPSDVEEALRLAWGEGQIVKVLGSGKRFWIDEAATRRARIPVESFDRESHVDVTFDSYTPVDRWLGDGRAIAAIPTGVLGMPLGDASAKYRGRGDLSYGSISILAQPTKWSRESTTEVLVSADRPSQPDSNAAKLPVTSVSWRIEYESQAERDHIIEVCAKKWGAAAQAARGEWQFAQADGNVLLVRDVLGYFDMELLPPTASELRPHL